MCNDPTKKPAAAGVSAKISGAAGRQGFAGGLAGARYDDSTIETARQRMESAVSWTKNHADAWAAFEGMATAYRAGRRLSAARYFEELRSKAWVARDGGDFKLNNNLRAPLVRLLLIKHPEFASKIELRRSTLDALGGGHYAG